MADNDARQQALRAIMAVMADGESLSNILPDITRKLEARDKSFAQMLVYGVLRWRWHLEAILNKLLQKPLKQKDFDIHCCLLLGLYQLTDTRVPQHAAVDATVKLVRSSGKSWATGLANAVMRNLIRSKEELIAEADEDESSRFSHPRWLISRIKKDWPNHWQSILDANNQHAPMTLRVNKQRISIEEYLLQLQIPAHRLDDALVLQDACDVFALPGFEQGWFSVQDAGAQLAAPLLDIKAGQHVLDACAAPGGKTAHILELQPDVSLLALDVSDARLTRVHENLQRLGLKADVRCGDAQETDWWNGEPFDRILLDAPCSATGVIRRHPDIKSLRRDEDISVLVATQSAILENLWCLLKPGGILLYVTCSVLRDENEQQIHHFLVNTPDAQESRIEADWGMKVTHGRQILPSENMDGFYYARLVKAA